VNAEHSRSLRLGASVTGRSESELARRMAQNSVVVSLDQAVPGSLDVAAIIVETLRRGPGHVYLEIDGADSGVIAALLTAANAVAPSTPVSTDPAPSDAVRVHVGTRSIPGAIAVLPDRHGVRLASDGSPLRQSSSPSALGVMTAAAFAEAEVFKRVVEPLPQRVVYPDRLAFCPVTLGDDPAAAPSLPSAWSPSLGLVGNGAVGTAHARVIGGLDSTSPSAITIDPQTYARENLGTYSLGTYDDARNKSPKVILVEQALRGWQVRRVQDTADAAIGKLEADALEWPRVVLTGLDSIEARRSAQGLWPVELIDSATGDTAVGLHHVVGSGPCLRCFFPEREAGHSAAEALAAEFGLPIDLVMQGTRVLVDADLSGLSTDQRERLRPHLGKPICGLADAARLTGTNDGYRPSIPFVSQQAACLGVGRLIASVVGLSELPNFVQYDALIGPQSMTRHTRAPRPGCYCQQRPETIRAVRVARQLV
jgi:molybdopterin/thiamine biosynthesis adenylyltransferase